MKAVGKAGVFTFGLLILVLVGQSRASEIRLSVAASMIELFKELKVDYQKQQPGNKLIFNFGPSGGLAKQIHQGAPADLYVSANPKWMTFLIEQNLIRESAKRKFAHNSLVFVGPKTCTATTLADLVTLDRIGLGSPKSVPAGQYAKQAMEKIGIYHRLLGDGKLVMAKDVRQALIYADRGETDGSFVYTTDALLASRAVILFAIPQQLYDRVTYPLALTREGENKAQAQEFMEYLTSPEASAIIKRKGFTLPGQSGQ